LRARLRPWSAHGSAAPAAQIGRLRAFICDDSPDGCTTFAIASGLMWAFPTGARVVNMIFAGPRDPDTARVAPRTLMKNGVVLVASGRRQQGASRRRFIRPPIPASNQRHSERSAKRPAAGLRHRGRYFASRAGRSTIMLRAPNGAAAVFHPGTSFFVSAAYVTEPGADAGTQGRVSPQTSASGAQPGPAHHLEFKGTDRAPAISPAPPCRRLSSRPCRWRPPTRGRGHMMPSRKPANSAS